MKNVRLVRLAMLLCLLIIPLSGEAATYYVDPNAPTDLGDGSSASPKKYISSGIALMVGGDTLILKDGIYTGQNNYIGDYGTSRRYLPSGSPGNFTTLKAEHVGQAIIDGQYTYSPFSMGNGPTYRNYLHIDGIHFRRGAGGLFSIAGNYNWVSNCGFEDGINYNVDTETSIAYVAGGSSYSLIEDCWVWGKGRYGFYTGSVNGGTHHVVFRRVVVRLDAVPAGWMSAGLRFYNGKNNAMQNCIVLDSLVGSNSGVNGTCAECWQFAQGGGSSTGELGHIFDSCIAMSSPERSAFTNEKGFLPSVETWRNSVFWGLKQGFFPYNLTLNSGYGASGQNVWNLENMLIGNSGKGIALSSTRLYVAFNISNSIFVGNASSAFGDSGFVLDRKVNNVIAYGNGSNACNTADRCVGNGVDSQTNPLVKILKYLPRVESGIIGPKILYQVGGTGTFSGDAGWDKASKVQLWPYPNEKLWAEKMRSYQVNLVSGNRGFAAVDTATPLTDYIWGYLGNAKPGNLYPVVDPVPNARGRLLRP